MKIMFYGFRHAHIEGLVERAKKNPRIEIAACVEENDEARKGVEERLHLKFDERPYEQLLQTDIDIVAIGCRYGERGQAIIKALQAGKHVIADKPICTSIEELNEIERLAKEKNLKIACMLDLRYLPSARAAKQAIAKNLYGTLRNVSFCGQHCLDYEHRPKWYYEQGMHGGTINDLGVHGVDLINWLTGERIKEVLSARTWNAYAKQEPHFEDCAIFMAELTNGAGVLADISYSTPLGVGVLPTFWEFRLWFDKAMLTFNFKDSDVTVYEEGKQQPEILEGIVPTSDWLNDLLDEIESGGNAFTESVLCSSRETLLAQYKATINK